MLLDLITFLYKLFGRHYAEMELLSVLRGERVSFLMFESLFQSLKLHSKLIRVGKHVSHIPILTHFGKDFARIIAESPKLDHKR